MVVTIEEYAAMAAEVYAGLRCISKQQFFEWALMLRAHNPQTAEEIQKEFCEDCHISYEFLMKDEGRCIRPEEGWQLENQKLRRHKFRMHEQEMRDGVNRSDLRRSGQ